MNLLSTVSHRSLLSAPPPAPHSGVVILSGGSHDTDFATYSVKTRYRLLPDRTYEVTREI